MGDILKVFDTRLADALLGTAHPLLSYSQPLLCVLNFSFGVAGGNRNRLAAA